MTALSQIATHDARSSLWPEEAKGAQRPSGDATGVILFLIPLLIFIKLQLLTTLFVSTLLVLLIAPWVVLRRQPALPQSTRVFVWLCAFWLLALIVSDLSAGSPTPNMVRGWSRAGVTVVTTLTLACLIGDRLDRARWFVWGWVIGLTVGTFVAPGSYLADNFWKWGLAQQATMLAALLACGPRPGLRGSLGMAMPIVVVGIADFALLSRFFGTAAIGTLVILIVLRHFGGQGYRLGRRLIGAGVAVLLAILVILPAYGAAARSGLIGEGHQRLFEQQSSGALGLLAGARLEFFGSLPAIRDSPFIGHGSNPSDYGAWYTQTLIMNAQRLGYAPERYESMLTLSDSELLIPTHSHVTQAWVEAGVIGALPWLWASVMAVRVLLRPGPKQEGMTPLVTYIAVVLLMDVFFSPYGAARLVVTPFYVGLLGAALPDQDAPPGGDIHE